MTFQKGTLALPVPSLLSIILRHGACGVEIAVISNRHIRETRETVFNAEFNVNREEYFVAKRSQNLSYAFPTLTRDPQLPSPCNSWNASYCVRTFVMLVPTRVP